MKALLSVLTFIVLLLVCAITAGVGITAYNLNESAKKTLLDIEQKKTFGNFAQIEKKLDEVMNAADKADIFIFSEKDARRWFLDTLDNLLKKYDAKVITPMQKVDNAYKSRVSFRFTPRDPAELAVLIDYLENSVAPIFIIETMAFIKTDREKYTNITAEIIQPFYQGSK